MDLDHVRHLRTGKYTKREYQIWIDNQLLPLGTIDKESLAMKGRRWTFIYLSTSPGTVIHPNILFGYKIQEKQERPCIRDHVNVM